MASFAAWTPAWSGRLIGCERYQCRRFFWLARISRRHGEGPLFEAAIEDTDNLIIPVITIYEVFKKVLRERGENEALQVAGMMQNGHVVDLDSALALEAAHYRLPLADSLIYATAMRHDATVWTQDEHFKDLPNVRFFPRQPKVS